MYGYRSGTGTRSHSATSRPVTLSRPALVSRHLVARDTGLSLRHEESIATSPAAFGNRQWKPNAAVEWPV